MVAFARPSPAAEPQALSALATPLMGVTPEGLLQYWMGTLHFLPTSLQTIADREQTFEAGLTRPYV